MNKIKSIALSLLAVVSTVSTSVTPALAGGKFTGTYLTLETNLDVWRSPRGRSREGVIFHRPIQIKPNLLTRNVICPAEEGGTQKVFVGPSHHPDMILEVTEPIKLDLLFHAQLISGQRAQLVVRAEDSTDFECFFERLLPIPVRSGSRRVSNPSFSRVVKPGRYGVWFGLVDKPARNFNDPTTSEDEWFKLFSRAMGTSNINAFTVYVDAPKR